MSRRAGASALSLHTLSHSMLLPPAAHLDPVAGARGRLLEHAEAVDAPLARLPHRRAGQADGEGLAREGTEAGSGRGAGAREHATQADRWAPASRRPAPAASQPAAIHTQPAAGTRPSSLPTLESHCDSTSPSPPPPPHDEAVGHGGVALGEVLAHRGLVQVGPQEHVLRGSCDGRGVERGRGEEFVESAGRGLQRRRSSRRPAAGNRQPKHGTLLSPHLARELVQVAHVLAHLAERGALSQPALQVLPDDAVLRRGGGGRGGGSGQERAAR